MGMFSLPPNIPEKQKEQIPYRFMYTEAFCKVIQRKTNFIWTSGCVFGNAVFTVAFHSFFFCY